MSRCGEPCDGCSARAEHHLCDKCCHEEPDAINRENQRLRVLVEELAKGPDLRACDTRGERNDVRNQWLLGLRERAKSALLEEP